MKENEKKANFKVILISLTAVFLVAAVIIIILLFNSNNKDSKSGSNDENSYTPLISQEESSEQEISREESNEISKEVSLSSEESSKEESKAEDSKAESSVEESKPENSQEESKHESSSEESKSESSREESKAESSKEESKEESRKDENREDNFPSNSRAYKQVYIKDILYYQRLDGSLWSGDYHQEKYYSTTSESIMKVVSYEEYVEILKNVKMDFDEDYTSLEATDENKLKPFYSDKNINYLVLSQRDGNRWCEMDLIDVVKEDGKIVVYGYENFYGYENIYGFMASGSGYVIAIPTYMPVGTEVEYIQCHTSEEIENLKQYGTTYDPYNYVAEKPIIYLYPEEETKVTVKLLKEENLTCTYPKYKSEWNVIAKPNGDLVDLNTGRNLYSLYYECKNSVHFKVEKDGFVVKGEDAASFLEEKLAVLGLTEREAEEFIVYWLPILEANKYNYIRFADIDDINENMPLELSTEPDSVIRVLMTFKGLDEPINVEEQQLTPAARTGFTVVEWGGTEIK